MTLDTLFDMTTKCCANYEAYFGNGTKLTVLGKYCLYFVWNVSSNSYCRKEQVYTSSLRKSGQSDHDQNQASQQTVETLYLSYFYDIEIQITVVNG